MEGSPAETPGGFTVTLNRRTTQDIPTPATALSQLSLIVEYQTNSRLRIKVQPQIRTIILLL